MPVDFELGSKEKSIKIPQVKITDKPRFQWRSFMLDESRHFKGAEEVKRLLDQMALLKMNVFHWHLTDDQGWRIEIKKYPLLTQGLMLLCTGLNSKRFLNCYLCDYSGVDANAAKQA